MTTDRVFVLLLVIMLPMSGCFGGVGDAEAGDNDVNDSDWINERGIGEPNWNISLSSNQWLEINSAYYLVEQQENNGNSSSTELINRGFIVKESNGWGMHGGQSQVFGGDYYSCLATSDDGQCVSSSEIFEGNIVRMEWSIIYRIHSV